MTDLTSLLSRHERWEARRSVIKSIVSEEKRSIEKLKQDITNIKGSIGLIQYIVEETSKSNEEQTSLIVTHALRETFFDQTLTLKLEHESYRGHPGVTFILKDEIRGIEGDPMTAFGGGPASLIGLVLQVLSVLRQPGMAHVLILDEPLSQISVEYQQAAGKILRKLCEPPPQGCGFKMLVVTHMDSIADAAHIKYRAVREDDQDSVKFIKEE